VDDAQNRRAPALGVVRSQQQAHAEAANQVGTVVPRLMEVDLGVRVSDGGRPPDAGERQLCEISVRSIGRDLDSSPVHASSPGASATLRRAWSPDGACGPGWRREISGRGSRRWSATARSPWTTPAPASGGEMEFPPCPARHLLAPSVRVGLGARDMISPGPLKTGQELQGRRCADTGW
jgi:hypothetical protein